MSVTAGEAAPTDQSQAAVCNTLLQPVTRLGSESSHDPPVVCSGDGERMCAEIAELTRNAFDFGLRQMPGGLTAILLRLQAAVYNAKY